MSTTFIERIRQSVVVAHRPNGPTATQTGVRLHSGYYAFAAHMVGRNGLPFGLYDADKKFVGDVFAMCIHPDYPIHEEVLPADKNDFAICVTSQPPGGYVMRARLTPLPKPIAGIMADWNAGTLELTEITIIPNATSAIIKSTKPLPTGASSSQIFYENGDGEPIYVGHISGGDKDPRKAAIAVTWERTNRAFFASQVEGPQWRRDGR